MSFMNELVPNQTQQLKTYGDYLDKIIECELVLIKLSSMAFDEVELQYLLPDSDYDSWLQEVGFKTLSLEGVTDREVERFDKEMLCKLQETKDCLESERENLEEQYSRLIVDYNTTKNLYDKSCMTYNKLNDDLHNNTNGLINLFDNYKLILNEFYEICEKSHELLSSSMEKIAFNVKVGRKEKEELGRFIFGIKNALVLKNLGSSSKSAIEAKEDVLLYHHSNIETLKSATSSSKNARCGYVNCGVNLLYRTEKTYYYDCCDSLKHAHILIGLYNSVIARLNSSLYIFETSARSFTEKYVPTIHKQLSKAKHHAENEIYKKCWWELDSMLQISKKLFRRYEELYGKGPKILKSLCNAIYDISWYSTDNISNLNNKVEKINKMVKSIELRLKDVETKLISATEKLNNPQIDLNLERQTLKQETKKQATEEINKLNLEKQTLKEVRSLHEQTREFLNKLYSRLMFPEEHKNLASSLAIRTSLATLPVLEKAASGSGNILSAASYIYDQKKILVDAKNEIMSAIESTVHVIESTIRAIEIADINSAKRDVLVVKALEKSSQILSSRMDSLSHKISYGLNDIKYTIVGGLDKVYNGLSAIPSSVEQGAQAMHQNNAELKEIADISRTISEYSRALDMTIRDDQGNLRRYDGSRVYGDY